jgi:hypothetical protein
MHKNIVLLVIVILATSTLFACAPALVSVPLHMPSNISNIREFNNIQSKNVRMVAPFPDGTPQYTIKLQTGSHKTPGGSSTVIDYIYAHTNADTKGLNLLADGSQRFSVTIGHFSDNSGSGYLVKNVNSENSLNARREEAQKEEAERRKTENEERKAKAAELKEQHCSNVRGEEYFCYDDSSKLTGHDIDAVSRLLSKITNRILTGKGNSTHHGDPVQSGQWYIESATENSISVTITGKRSTDLIGETVLDKKLKAGNLFYFERNAPVETKSVENNRRSSGMYSVCTEKCEIDKSARDSACTKGSVADIMNNGYNCMQLSKKYYENCKSACLNDF